MATSKIWRSRPIFITSTFRDMHAERDRLRIHVFPVLEEFQKALLAWVHGEARSPDARRYLGEIGPDLQIPGMAEGAMWSMFSRVVFHYGDVEQAAWLYERAVPHAAKNSAVGGNMCSGTISHAVALLAGGGAPRHDPR